MRPSRGFLAIVFVLASCANVESQRNANLLPIFTMPNNWTAGDKAIRINLDETPVDLARWWTFFNDPLLTQCIEQALQSNTSVASAQITLRQALALRELANASLWPTLFASASAQHNRSGTGQQTQRNNAFQGSLDAQWQPDIFGGNQAGVRASDADAHASLANLGAVQIAIAAEVANSYFQLRGTQMRLAVAQNNLVSQLDTAQIAEWRRQAGLLTSIDSEQARAAAEQTRAQLPVLQNLATQLIHGLVMLSGSAPNSLNALQMQLEIGADLPPTPRHAVLPTPANNLRQRPDILAAEWQINAAIARYDQANSARFPTFQLGGGIGVKALTISGLTSGSAFLGNVIASVTGPIFDGGARQAQVNVSFAAFEEAQVAYRAAAILAVKEVEDALAASRNDQQRLISLELATQASANASSLARQLFASGLTDFQTVLETQRALFNAQDALASTQTDLSADWVRLYRALGGGWVASQLPTAQASAVNNFNETAKQKTVMEQR